MHIKRHIDQIQSPDIYLEQTIYNQINDVITAARLGFRFREQEIMIDFSPITFGIHMQVDEETSKGFFRYKNLSVPKWFGVSLRPPDFLVTPHVNNMQAFFHYNHGDCQILPANYVIDHKKVKMDIDRNLYFIKIACSSVEEARRRAIVLAYLTYDMTRHQFVRVHTGQMLENPFNLNSIYETHELFGLEMTKPEIDVKSLIRLQAFQDHQGMILSDKDAIQL